MKALQKQYQLLRLMLLISLLLFLTGLFALVSHWSSAIPIILFACVFRLAAVGWARRKYAAAWMEQSAVAAAEKTMRAVSYTAKEAADGDCLETKGLLPQMSLVPNAQLHHVLRGSVDNKTVTVSECAFVRSDKGAAGKTIAGTLLIAEKLLPESENWLILRKAPFDSFIDQSAFEAWTEIPLSAGTQAICLSCGGETSYAEKAATVLASALPEYSAALAAKDGALSMLLPGTFYAHRPALSQTPSEELIARGEIAGVKALQKLCRALGPQAVINKDETTIDT
ncbi:MAG: hypothetical protein IJ649_02870 [Oscillospiraceae bacterium]|nr:hypothetical protein [Oscillospiraceae bacterium]